MRQHFRTAGLPLSTLVASGTFALHLARAIADSTATATADKYEIGGPLAGLKLPLFPSQLGAPPGHPVVIPVTTTPLYLKVAL
jgi:hypothetical protein